MIVRFILISIVVLICSLGLGQSKETCPTIINFRDLGNQQNSDIKLLDINYRYFFETSFAQNPEIMLYPVSFFSSRVMPFDIGLGGGISISEPVSYGYGKFYVLKNFSRPAYRFYSFGIGGYTDFIFGNKSQRFGVELANNFRIGDRGSVRLLVGSAYQSFEKRWQFNLGLSLTINKYARPLIMHRKPVLYAYNEDSIQVDIKLNYNGELTFVYPSFDERWDVTVCPDGMVQDNTTFKKYPYLFWEGKYHSSVLGDIDYGFVVQNAELVPFLEDKLSEIGLNATEITDFITFWVPLLNEKQYAIKFYQQDACNSLATYDVFPVPDNFLRLYVTFEAVNGQVNLLTPTLHSISRTGFTLVEWGGMILNEEVAEE